MGGIVLCLYGAEGETRTLTMLPPTDFESAASTSSATPARISEWVHHIIVFKGDQTLNPSLKLESL